MIRLSKDRYVDRSEDSPLCVKNRHLVQEQQFYPSIPVSFTWGICFARRRMSVGPMEGRVLTQSSGVRTADHASIRIPSG